jgi:hypothetical protein
MRFPIRIYSFPNTLGFQSFQTQQINGKLGNLITSRWQVPNNTGLILHKRQRTEFDRKIFKIEGWQR